MYLKELESKYRGDVFRNIPNAFLSSSAEEWNYYSSVLLNAPIAIGWLSNDDLLVINGDGIFVHDVLKKTIIFKDYETSFRKYISEDNLSYRFKDENVNIFGLRGGGGNLLTKDSRWGLELINLSWNVQVPRLLNYKTGDFYFLALHQVDYEGRLHIGFSKTEKYFAIMGDGGVDLYSNNLLHTEPLI